MTMIEQAGTMPGLPEEPGRYFIDIQWYNDTNRSFDFMARQRICDECRDRFGEEVEERVARIDEETGRVVFDTKSVPYGSNPLTVIRDCCAKQRNYITAQTPILEAVFRVLLANGNQPMDLEAIRQQLTEWVRLETKPHAYAPELLEQLIAADTYYGLRRFNIEE